MMQNKKIHIVLQRKWLQKKTEDALEFYFSFFLQKQKNHL